MKFWQESSNPGIQSAVDSERLGSRPFKTNFVFTKDGRFISIQFDVDSCFHGRDQLDQNTVDG